MKIDINCKSKNYLELTELCSFQGNLKERTDEDIELMVNSIKQYGFSFPFFVWKQDSKNYIIDGHGRLKALAIIKDEGYEIPPLPIVYINAENIDKAKELLLYVNSQYGEINTYELNKLIDDIDVKTDEINIQNVNLDDVLDLRDSIIYEPTFEPIVDTSLINDKKIEEAKKRLEKMEKSNKDTYIELECKACKSRFSLQKSSIIQWLKTAVD